MVINSNVVVKMDNTTVSSLVENGGVADGMRNLTINGGDFSGGVDNVKNEPEGILIINGGSFYNTLHSTIWNYHRTTINGGTFTVDHVAEGNIDAALYTNRPQKGVQYNIPADGLMIINGGTFNAKSLITTDEVTEVPADEIPPVEISGGTFNVDYVVSPDYEGNAKHFEDTKITGGTFADGVELPALPEGYFKYDVVDPSTKEAVTIVTDQQVNFESSTIAYSMQVGGKYQMDLPELVAKYGVVNNFVGGIDGVDGGAVTVDGTTVTAAAAGHATVTISFNGETRIYNFTIAEVDTDAPDVTPPVADTADKNADIAAPNTGVKFMSIASVVAGGITALLFAGVVAKRAFDNK